MELHGQHVTVLRKVLVEILEKVLQVSFGSNEGFLALWLYRSIFVFACTWFSPLYLKSPSTFLLALD